MSTRAKKTLFLHIGSHKTATTFLQSSLARNPQALAGLGLLYPEAGRIHEAHFRLAWALRDPALRDLPLDRLGDWPALCAEIDASPLPAAILSCEEFGLGCQPQRLAPLAASYDVRVLYYLRSPDSLLESFYNQVVKDGGTRETRTIETYVAEEAMPVLDPQACLRPWAETFGPAALRVRLYGAASQGAGILADLLAAMDRRGLPAFAPPAATIWHKASLPPDALDYLRLCNRWSDSDAGQFELALALVGLGKARGAELQETRAGILSLKARQALRRRFLGANRRVAELYLGSDRSPFPPAEAPTPAADVDRRPLEASAAVMAKVATMLRQKRG